MINYKIKNREVGPVTDLLSALVELNWHIRRAEAEGWAIEVETPEGSNTVSISIFRSEWPSEESKAEAAAAKSDA